MRDWKKELTPEQFRVARKGGTERAYTGKYWAHKERGTYTCVCCGQPLFESSDKFDSGTGWPSFTRPAAAENVGSIRVMEKVGMQYEGRLRQHWVVHGQTRDSVHYGLLREEWERQAEAARSERRAAK